jgi:hypothetical protein
LGLIKPLLKNPTHAVNCSLSLLQALYFWPFFADCYYPPTYLSPSPHIQWVRMLNFRQKKQTNVELSSSCTGHIYPQRGDGHIYPLDSMTIFVYLKRLINSLVGYIRAAQLSLYLYCIRKSGDANVWGGKCNLTYWPDLGWATLDDMVNWGTKFVSAFEDGSFSIHSFHQPTSKQTNKPTHTRSSHRYSLVEGGMHGFEL